jgi:DNA (cytosine-5)-methyltransferase 1
MYNFIELCAGAGGLSCGLIKAGLNASLLNDNNKDACNTLKLNHPDTNIICDDMNNIDLDNYINNIDILAGGVPCQSFSYAGKTKGIDDKRGELIISFLNTVCKLQPKIFLIENVKGLLTHNNKDTLKSILNTNDINKLYNVKYKVLNAYNYEVPQKRERLFIVGILSKYNLEFDFPVEINNKINLKDVLIDVPDSLCAKYNSNKIDLFKKIPQGGNWKNLDIEEQKKYLGNSFNSGGGKTGILKRLDMNEPSLTLLCSPSQKQTERCHPLYERPLSIRESARIQTFSDSYKFTGCLTSQYKQIGNAVPVNLSYYIGKKIIEILDKINQ